MGQPIQIGFALNIKINKQEVHPSVAQVEINYLKFLRKNYKTNRNFPHT